MTTTLIPIPTINQVHTPPNSAQTEDEFNANADGLLGNLPTLVRDLNDFGTAANALGAMVLGAASDAAVAGGAAKWVSGTTYAQGDNVWSPTNFQTYKRKTAGSGTTDPANDNETSWALIGPKQGHIVAPLAAGSQYPTNTRREMGVCAYSGQGTLTGTFKLTVPACPNTGMIITIEGNNLVPASTGWCVKIPIYGAGASGVVYNASSATVTGEPPFTDVRIAYNGTNTLILLGVVSTAWSYPHVIISVDSTYSGWNADYTTGWNASIVTDETGITVTKQVDTVSNRFPSLGVVKLRQGLTFGNTGTGDSLTLDYYQEDIALTPTVQGGTTAGTGTYTIQQGKASRVGNRYKGTITLAWTAHTGAGNMKIYGLPAIAANVTNQNFAVSVSYDTLTVGAGKQLSAEIQPNTNNIVLYSVDPAGGAMAGIAVDTTCGKLVLTFDYEV